MALNLNSIYSHQRRMALSDFLLQHKPDMLLVSETKLKPNCRVSFAGYTFVRDDRIDQGPARNNGGTGIIIAEGIAYEHVRLPEFGKNKLVETTVIRMRLSGSKKLYVVSAYGRTVDSTDFHTEFNRLFTALDLSHPDNYFVIAGDWNARHRSWLNPVNNARGNAISSWLDTNGMAYRAKLHHTSMPTFDRGSSYLDIAIVDTRIQLANTIHAYESTNHNDFGLLNVPYDSDHNAIEMLISLDDDDAFIRHPTEGRYRYETADWSAFNTHMYMQFRRRTTATQRSIVPVDRNLSNEEVDDYVETLEQVVHETMQHQIKRTRSHTSSQRYTNWRIVLLKRRKNDVIKCLFDAKKWPTFTTPERLRQLKSELACLQKMLKDNFRIVVNRHWTDVFKGINARDSKNALPTINRIFRNRKKAHLENIILSPGDAQIVDQLQLTAEQFVIESSGSINVHQPDAILRVLGHRFAAVNTHNRHMGGNSHARAIATQADQMLSHSEYGPLVVFGAAVSASNRQNDPRFTNQLEVSSIIRRTNNKKSSGIDNIPNVVIHHLPSFLTRELVVLFNHCINNSYYPKRWKIGKVYAALKPKKDPTQPSSYRPLVLYANFSKIFEKVIHRQTIAHVDAHQLTPDAQFGFRRGHSTVHAINKLLSEIAWQKNGRSGVGACLIDIEKAFDTVWLDGLMWKLKNDGFPTHLLTTIHSMLYGKRFFVTDGERCTSPEFRNEDGLQQGTVLAPLLYMLYTRHLLLDSAFNTTNTGIIAFADDIIVYTGGAYVADINRRLQRAVNVVATFFEDWKQRINVTKCETILFRSALRDGPADFQRHWRRFGIELNGVRVTNKESVRYLGVQLSNKGNFNEHCRSQISKSRKVFFVMRKVFYSRSVDSAVKTLCYKTLIRPILTYGCAAWFCIDPWTMEQYRRFERQCLRCCLRSGWTTTSSGELRYISNAKLYEAVNVSRIDNFIVKLVRDHYARISSIENATIAFTVQSATQAYISHALHTGYVPPEAFVELDARGYIQDANGIPVLYHILRDHPKAAIRYEPTRDIATVHPERVLYERSIPPCDAADEDALRRRYWWK